MPPTCPAARSPAGTVGKTYAAPDGEDVPAVDVPHADPSQLRAGKGGRHPGRPVQLRLRRGGPDALAFAALFDRLMQNLRRFLGCDVQYFAAVEPQRRLAPHIDIAMRGTVSRAELRRVLAATYHQVWWPDTTTVRFEGEQRPVWDEQTCTYVDPYTGEVLPTWDDALDAIGAEDKPRHVARFGERFDAQGVLSGSKDAARCIGYLTKYLTKQVADCHQADTDAGQAHAARLAEALRYEPCSPRCANWLTATLGISATDPARYTWQPVSPGDPDHMEHARRLLHVVADRARWQAALTEARRKAAMHEGSDVLATGRAA